MCVFISEIEGINARAAQVQNYTFSKLTFFETITDLTPWKLIFWQLLMVKVSVSTRYVTILYIILLNGNKRFYTENSTSPYIVCLE